MLEFLSVYACVRACLCVPVCVHLVRPGGGDAETAGRNKIRKCITTFFRERKCVMLVRPAADERQLQELDKQPWESLRPEFRTEMTRLREMLFSNARIKTVNGRALNGPMLASLAETYVKVRA